jgi:hypothetical protein
MIIDNGEGVKVALDGFVEWPLEVHMNAIKGLLCSSCSRWEGSLGVLPFCTSVTWYEVTIASEIHACHKVVSSKIAEVIKAYMGKASVP